MYITLVLSLSIVYEKKCEQFLFNVWKLLNKRTQDMWMWWKKREEWKYIDDTRDREYNGKEIEKEGIPKIMDEPERMAVAVQNVLLTICIL